MYLTAIHISKNFVCGDKLGFHSSSTSQEYVYAMQYLLLKGKRLGWASQHKLHIQVKVTTTVKTKISLCTL
jgi:hypothetical protein